MKFEIPHELTYCDEISKALWPADELCRWLDGHDIAAIFMVENDVDRTWKQSKYLTLEINDLRKALLFKLTWG